MEFKLTKAQRLLIIIGISFSFFLAEIGGALTDPPSLTRLTLSNYSRILYQIPRGCSRRLPLCKCFSKDTSKASNYLMPGKVE